MTDSPCIQICQLDAREEYCLGCGRSLAEIAAWPQLTQAQRAAVVARLERLANDARI